MLIKKSFQSLLSTLIQKDASANKVLIEVDETTCLHIRTSLSTLLCKLSVDYINSSLEGCCARTGNSSFCRLSCNFLSYAPQIMRFLLPFVLRMLLAQEKYLLDFYSLLCSGRGCILFPQKQYRERHEAISSKLLPKNPAGRAVTTRNMKD